MKRIILFLLIIGMVVAQPKPVAIQERINPPIEIISDAYFASTISSHGLEKAVYNITITNKEEDSMDVKLKFRFSSTPEKLFLSQNNQEIGLELTSESPFKEYTKPMSINGNSKASFVLKYETYHAIEALGLWDLEYRYEIPLFIESNEEQAQIYKGINYNGKIIFDSEPKKVECNNCFLNKDTVTVRDNTYFNLSWSLKRLPIKAGIVYLALVIYLIFLLLNVRKK